MYIKREDAIKACELQMMIAKDGSTLGGYYPRADEIAEKIKAIPSADVVTVEMAQSKIMESVKRIGEATDEWSKGYIDGLTQAIDNLAYLPSADVVERSGKTCANGCRWLELDGSCSNPKGVCEIEYRW